MTGPFGFEVSLPSFTVSCFGVGAGPPRAWRGPGQIFLGAPISKFFPENFFSDNNNPPPPPPSTTFWGKHFLDEQPRPQALGTRLHDEYVVIAFLRLYLNFSYQKPPNILPFARKYFAQKNDWGPTKNF